MNKENIKRSANYDLIGKYVGIRSSSVKMYFIRHGLKINNPEDVNTYIKYRENFCSGVYCIMNKINGKKYIGYSKNMEYRKKTHFTQLKNKKHINKLLQMEVTLYGIENFMFTVLFKHDNDIICRAKEKELIGLCDVGIIYNIQDTSIDMRNLSWEDREFIKNCIENKDKVKNFLKG